MRSREVCRLLRLYDAGVENPTTTAAAIATKRNDANNVLDDGAMMKIDYLGTHTSLRSLLQQLDWTAPTDDSNTYEERFRR
jgi:hypothetical protein